MILGSGGDDEGRFCYAQFELAGRKLACFLLNTPMPYSNLFFHTMSKILTFSDYELIIGMDANAFFLNPVLVGILQNHSFLTAKWSHGIHQCREHISIAYSFATITGDAWNYLC